MTEGYSLGLDLGGTKLLACLCDREGRIHYRESQPSGRNFGPADLRELLAAISERIRAAGFAITSLGIGFPGLVNAASGIARSTIMLDGWEQVPLAEMLREQMAVPCAIDNDVNNLARAELAVGAAQGRSHVLFVGVGTGIGGAVVIDGRIHGGASGLAGELGHISVDHAGPACACGGQGCVNLYASGTAMETRLGIPLGTLALALKEQAEESWQVIYQGARMLGRSLATAMAILNPEQILIGGSVVHLGIDYLEQVRETALRATFREVTADCIIDFAGAGYEAAGIGAALLGWEQMEAE